MFSHDRYQAFCRVCTRVFEADSANVAVSLATAHEKEMEALVKEGKRHSRTHAEIEEVACETVRTNK